MTALPLARLAALLFIFVAAVEANPGPSPADPVHYGFTQAQACEAEIDDDLTSCGECIGHTADRITSQRQASRHLSLLGLYFQAWLIADLAARQGSTRSPALRQRYQQALTKSLRITGWSLKRLCTAKQLGCEPIELRLQQKL